MAASKSLILLCLMVACLCATASAGRVTPAETIPMKLALVVIDVAVEIRVSAVGFLPTDKVTLVLQNAVNEPVVLHLVGGVLELVKDVHIKVNVDTDPVALTLEALTVTKTFDVPLAALIGDLGPLGALVGTLVPIVLTVVKTVAGAIVKNAAGTVLGAIAAP